MKNRKWYVIEKLYGRGECEVDARIVKATSKYDAFRKSCRFADMFLAIDDDTFEDEVLAKLTDIQMRERLRMQKAMDALYKLVDKDEMLGIDQEEVVVAVASKKQDATVLFAQLDNQDMEWEES